MTLSLSVFLPFCLSIRPPFKLLHILLFLCLSIYLLCVCLSACPFIHLFVPLKAFYAEIYILLQQFTAIKTCINLSNKITVLEEILFIFLQP